MCAEKLETRDFRQSLMASFRGLPAYVSPCVQRIQQADTVCATGQAEIGVPNISAHGAVNPGNTAVQSR